MTSTSEKVQKGAKGLVILICLAGFLYQTLQFLFLYWNYPTVVDIQVSVPSEVELPGITFCNHNGLSPKEICKTNGTAACIAPFTLQFVDFCGTFSDYCIDKKMPDDIQIIAYTKFSQEKDFSQGFLRRLSLPLKEYFECNITFSGTSRECNSNDFVIGSYYSQDELPNICYSINTLWSQPDKPIEKIGKGEKIKMRFYMPVSNTDKPRPKDTIVPPKYNYPSTPAVQLSVHSPYIVPSPFAVGVGLLGGKSYEIHLKQEEKHLLPSPYQTNCTDYEPQWRARGGFGPLSQMMVVQECRMNSSLRERGCVPVSVDYPHNYTVCRFCGNTANCNGTEETQADCTLLLRKYNQPCDSIVYDMEVHEKLIAIVKKLETPFVRNAEAIQKKVKAYDCNGYNVWKRECQTVDVEITFDHFEITNITYNPKFESLEVFSVVGGYMGMWLGISLVAIYDFLETFLGAACRLMKRKSRKVKHRKMEKRSKERKRRDNNREWDLGDREVYYRRKQIRMY